MSHDRAVQPPPVEEKKEQRYPLLREAISGVTLPASHKIKLDDFSRDLLVKAPAKQRFAWVGWLIDEEPNAYFELYCRPGFPHDISDEMKARMIKKYGEIVITQEGFPGQVHKETIRLVNQRRESQGLPMRIDVRSTPSSHSVATIGFSSVKTQDDALTFKWLSRSIYNETSFNVNQFASFPWLINDGENPALHIYNLERSIPEDYFRNIITALGKELKEEKQIINEKENYTFQYEKLWNDLIHLDSPEREKKMGEWLMLPIFFAAKMPYNEDLKKEIASFAESVADIFEQASEYKIPLDLDLIPHKYKDGKVTALMHAVDNGYTGLVALYLKNGANPNTLDANNETALFRAVKLGFLNITMLLLLENKANLFLKNNQGQTLLHLAVMQADERIVEEILRYEKNIQEEKKQEMTLWKERDAAGETPLTLIVKNASWHLHTFFRERSHIIKTILDHTLMPVVNESPDQAATRLSLAEKIQMFILFHAKAQPIQFNEVTFDMAPEAAKEIFLKLSAAMKDESPSAYPYPAAAKAIVEKIEAMHFDLLKPSQGPLFSH